MARVLISGNMNVMPQTILRPALMYMICKRLYIIRILIDDICGVPFMVVRSNCLTLKDLLSDKLLNYPSQEYIAKYLGKYSYKNSALSLLL